MGATTSVICSNTQVATSGPAGAEQVENGVFDLVITDLMMPEVDGDRKSVV
jgi:CheY-like chemotaxis protein